MIAALHSAQERVAVDSERGSEIIGSRLRGRRHRLGPRRAAPPPGSSACDAIGEPGLSARHAPRARVRSARLAADRRCRPGLRPDARAPSTLVTGLFETDRGQELNELGAEQPLSAVDELCDTLAARVDELRDWTEWRVWRERAREHGWERLRHRAHHRAGRRDAGARRPSSAPIGTVGSRPCTTTSRSSPRTSEAAPSSAGSMSSASSIASSCEPGPTV